MLACTKGSCSPGNYCASNGFCQLGCEDSTICDSTTSCDPVEHTCVKSLKRAIGTESCATGYIAVLACSATTVCAFNGIPFEFWLWGEPCPTGYTSHGEMGCTGPQLKQYCVPTGW